MSKISKMCILSIILDEGGDGDDECGEGDGVAVQQGQHDSRA